MTKLDWVKQGLGFVIGVGVSKIITDIVDENVDQDTAFEKVTVFTGRVAITMVVKELVQERINASIDAKIAWYNENVKPRLEEK